MDGWSEMVWKRGVWGWGGGEGGEIVHLAQQGPSGGEAHMCQHYSAQLQAKRPSTQAQRPPRREGLIKELHYPGTNLVPASQLSVIITSPSCAAMLPCTYPGLQPVPFCMHAFVPPPPPIPFTHKNHHFPLGQGDNCFFRNTV